MERQELGMNNLKGAKSAHYMKSSSDSRSIHLIWWCTIIFLDKLNYYGAKYYNIIHTHTQIQIDKHKTSTRALTLSQTHTHIYIEHIQRNHVKQCGKLEREMNTTNTIK